MGLRSLALQSRWTVALETPADWAIVRTVHRVRLAGGWVTRVRIRARTGGSSQGLRPRPLASVNPARPVFRKRASHLMTTGRATPTLAAVWV